MTLRLILVACLSFLLLGITKNSTDLKTYDSRCKIWNIRGTSHAENLLD